MIVTETPQHPDRSGRSVSALYAVKIGDSWRLATVARAETYPDPRPRSHPVPDDALVWCEYRTTHWLGLFGDEEFKIELQYANGTISTQARLNSKLVNLEGIAVNIQDCAKLIEDAMGEEVK